MSKFSEIDKIIAYENNINYWQDDELDYVGSLVENFQDEDWKELKSSWSSRSDVWKERCAQVLNYRPCDESLEILCQMLDSTNPNLVMNVITSLRSFGQEYEKSKYLRLSTLANAEMALRSSEVRQDWKDEYSVELRALFS